MTTTQTTRELRYLPAAELRVQAEGEGPDRLVGYAALFGRRSELLYGSFVEVIAPGAFAGALEGADVRCLWNHDSSHVLGRTRSGTLKVEEDELGLRIEATPPDTQWARDLMTSIERGDVDQMSFGFRVARDEWTEEGDLLIRTILEIEELYEVSPVTFPAYPDTAVAVRSLERWREAKSDAAPAARAGIEIRRRRLRLAEAGHHVPHTHGRVR
ncbi:MAG TPA: HK97 family phage prohead protease [Brevibacterium sp.]|nr:HK97 family phage prohead protease [Brevibacterium sp.]